MAKMQSFGFQDALSLVMGKPLVNSRRLCGRISQDLPAGEPGDGQIFGWMSWDDQSVIVMAIYPLVI
jgi:hypothetical protein